MRIVLTLIAIILFINGYTQKIDPTVTISRSDSILLQNFWSTFKAAVTKEKKAQLLTICEFPFYCTPCLNDTNIKSNNQATIKVTKELFLRSVYKMFFEKPIQKKVLEVPDFTPTLNIRNKQDGFVLIYTIVAPSDHWEGQQGMITLKKINGKYKITGIDTIP